MRGKGTHESPKVEHFTERLEMKKSSEFQKENESIKEK
jgi:hypothetical protein